MTSLWDETTRRTRADPTLTINGGSWQGREGQSGNTETTESTEDTEKASRERSGEVRSHGVTPKPR